MTVKQKECTAQAAFQALIDELPALVARQQVGRLTGGTITPKTLAMDDSRRRGPKESLMMNGKRVYPRAAFVDYLRGKVEGVICVSD